MSWSEIRDIGGILTGYTFVTNETVNGVAFTYTDTFDTNFELVSTRWEDDASNSSEVGETVTDVVYDFDFDGVDDVPTTSFHSHTTPETLQHSSCTQDIVWIPRTLDYAFSRFDSFEEAFFF